MVLGVFFYLLLLLPTLIKIFGGIRHFLFFICKITDSEEWGGGENDSSVETRQSFRFGQTLPFIPLFLLKITKILILVLVFISLSMVFAHTFFIYG